MSQLPLPFSDQNKKNNHQTNLFVSIAESIPRQQDQDHQQRCHAHRDEIRARIEEVFVNPLKFHTQHRQPQSQHLKGMKLKKRLSLVQELGLFCMAGLGMWGVSHVALNQSAFTQIAAFRIESMKASLLESQASLSANEKNLTEANALEPVREIKNAEPIKPNNYAAKVFEKMALMPSDNRVVIERIGKDIPLISVPNHQNWNQLEEFIQKGLQDGAVVHPISHEPGVFGNFFVTGHSSYYQWDKGRYKDVFALLHEVKDNDIIKVYWEGREYRYRLYEKRVVPPTETSVLNQPNDRSLITLMTCTPVGTNKNRLILVGELIE